MAKTTKAAILRQLQAARTHEENERGKGRRAVSGHYDRGADLVMMELSNGFGFPTSAIPRFGAGVNDGPRCGATQPGRWIVRRGCA